jgi:hypothetical protein
VREVQEERQTAQSSECVESFVFGRMLRRDQGTAGVNEQTCRKQERSRRGARTFLSIRNGYIA